MATAPSDPVHLRCDCGQRLRVRNPQPGQPVTCPRCGRPLALDAPLPSGENSDMQLQPIAPPEALSIAATRDAPREAVLLDAALLRVAPHGSNPGLTGRIAHTHVEAMLMTAQTGRPLDAVTLSSDRPRPGARDSDTAVSLPIRSAGSFFDDVLATFYFAGSRTNIASVGATAAVCMLFVTLGKAFSLGPFLLQLVELLLLIFAGVVAIQFCWAVLSATAAGEDTLPIVAANWEFWEDVARPTLLMVLVTALCGMPAWMLHRYATPNAPGYLWLLVALIVLGTAVWPMAVLLASVGNSLMAARPDRVARCILRVGPAYLIAWLAALLTVSAWAATYAYRDRVAATPYCGPALAALIQTGLTFYYGYALFRILGLLYRYNEAKIQSCR